MFRSLVETIEEEGDVQRFRSAADASSNHALANINGTNEFDEYFFEPQLSNGGTWIVTDCRGDIMSKGLRRLLFR